MKKTIWILSLLLCLSLLMAMTGCGKENKPSQDITKVGEFTLIVCNANDQPLEGVPAGLRPTGSNRRRW